MNDSNILDNQQMHRVQHRRKRNLHSPTEQDSVTHARNRKHKFINKIKQIAPQATRLVDPYASRVDPHRVVQLVTIRERNNESAKKSRRRSKIYTQLLEEQITNIELDLFQINDEIEMLRTEIFNALMHTDEVNKKNAQTQSHIIKKLKGLVRKDEEGGERARERDTEISICLDSCIYRIGASGSERKAILDILYTGFINRNLPNIYRYILWSAVNGVHLFQNGQSEMGQDKLWSEIKDIGEEVIRGHEQYLSHRGETIRKKGRQILSCSRKILKIKKQIEGYGQCYDEVLKEVRQILSPVQFAQLFLFVQRSIHKRQLRLLKDQYEEEEEDVLRPQSTERDENVSCQKMQKPVVQIISNRRKKVDDQNIKGKQSYKNDALL